MLGYGHTPEPGGARIEMNRLRSFDHSLAWQAVPLATVLVLSAACAGREAGQMIHLSIPAPSATELALLERARVEVREHAAAARRRARARGTPEEAYAFTIEIVGGKDAYRIDSKQGEILLGREVLRSFSQFEAETSTGTSPALVFSLAHEVGHWINEGDALSDYEQEIRADEFALRALSGPEIDVAAVAFIETSDRLSSVYSAALERARRDGTLQARLPELLTQCQLVLELRARGALTVEKHAFGGYLVTTAQQKVERARAVNDARMLRRGLAQELERCYRLFAEAAEYRFSTDDDARLRSTLRRYDEFRASLATAETATVTAEDERFVGPLSWWRGDSAGAVVVEAGPVRPVGLDVGVPFGWSATARVVPPGLFEQGSKDFLSLCGSYLHSPAVKAVRFGFGMFVDEPLSDLGDEIFTQRMELSLGAVHDDFTDGRAQWGLYAEAATGVDVRATRRLRFSLLVSGGIMLDDFVHAYRGEYGFPLGASFFF